MKTKFPNSPIITPIFLKKGAYETSALVIMGEQISYKTINILFTAISLYVFVVVVTTYF
ncbi:MAG: hypothetical protein ACJAXH_001653 [Colwellia sp.]|jgi:hypothetical protein